ncbi:MAG TPA: prolyl oligopeptidase family serine peptidase [Gaiellaceae bacterium]|nr:prolyl oligopeptidase family serine peptidase [Gaiellaceae bacterium]
MSAVRHWGLRYRAHNGVPRWAVVVLPSEYGPDNPPPPLPLVISPHGRGVRARTNARLWRELPARGPFAVICPGGMGRRLPLHSWGWTGQIDDLARMPSILRDARPWLRIDAERVYAVGGSMGGQETLLLLGRHPRLLAGAVAFDSVTDFGLRYRQFARLARTRALQGLARIEVGGTPSTNPQAYRLRSPMHWIEEIARAGVPLEMWWSDADEIVVDQHTQSARFFEELRALGPRARVEKVTGSWSHTAESYARLQLPGAVSWLGLAADV